MADDGVETQRTMQRSREMQPVTDELRANYTAARAFLFGEWFGASLMCASFTLLYLLTFATRGVTVPWILAPSAALFALGTFVYLRNRGYYQRLEFPWAKRWHIAALVVAGAGAVFWLLFLLLGLLTGFGVDVGPGK